MRERPIVDLVMGLQQLGADVTCTEDYPNCPPVLINAKGGLPGGTVQISASKLVEAYFSNGYNHYRPF